MVALVKVFGVVLAFFGITVLVRPSVLDSFLIFWQQGNRLQFAVLMRFVMGSVLVTAAPRCRLPGVILIVGVVLFVSGVAGLVVGPERLRSLARCYADRSPMVKRLWAVVSTALGVLVLHAS
jgi:uncharacterized membrane protein YgdD (TMEM256/DUF423 family)